MRACSLLFFSKAGGLHVHLDPFLSSHADGGDDGAGEVVGDEAAPDADDAGEGPVDDDPEEDPVVTARKIAEAKRAEEAQKAAEEARKKTEEAMKSAEEKKAESPERWSPFP